MSAQRGEPAAAASCLGVARLFLWRIQLFSQVRERHGGSEFITPIWNGNRNK